MICFVFTISITCMYVSASATEPKKNESESKSTLKKELITKFNVSQISFTNWAKGGDNMIAYNSGIVTGLKKNHPQYNWHLHGNFLFGQTKQGGSSLKNTLDKIDVDANITIKEKKYMNPYFSLTFDSQFARGYDYKKAPPVAKSGFWDPAYMVESAGSGVIVSQNFQSKLGMAIKETFTRNFRQYSDDGKTTDKKEWLKVEPGLNSRTDFTYRFNHKIKVTSKLILFSNLEAFNEIDMRWDSNLQAKLAKYISVDLSLFALYDKDVSVKTQIRQFLGIGFNYNFF